MKKDKVINIIKESFMGDVVELLNYLENLGTSDAIHNLDDFDEIVEYLEYKPSDIVLFTQQSPRFNWDGDGYFGFIDNRMFSFESILDDIAKENFPVYDFITHLSQFDTEDFENFTKDMPDNTLLQNLWKAYKEEQNEQ